MANLVDAKRRFRRITAYCSLKTADSEVGRYNFQQAARHALLPLSGIFEELELSVRLFLFPRGTKALFHSRIETTMEFATSFLRIHAFDRRESHRSQRRQELSAFNLTFRHLWRNF
jgi:hypothetical protein